MSYIKIKNFKLIEDKCDFILPATRMYLMVSLIWNIYIFLSLKKDKAKKERIKKTKTPMLVVSSGEEFGSP